MDCVFIVDGTYMVFDQRPPLMVKYFGLVNQIIHIMLWLFVTTKGGKGISWSASQVLVAIQMFLNQVIYFKLLNWRVFGFITWWICSYKQPAASIPVNKIFNDLFSIPRTIVERCIGSLKSRFRSLRGIRTPIRERPSHDWCAKIPYLFRHLWPPYLLNFRIMTDHTIIIFPQNCTYNVTLLNDKLVINIPLIFKSSLEKAIQYLFFIKFHSANKYAIIWILRFTS